MRRLLYHILAGFRQTLGHGGAKVADRAESDGAIELVAALSLRAQCGAGAGASQCAKLRQLFLLALPAKKGVKLSWHISRECKLSVHLMPIR